MLGRQEATSLAVQEYMDREGATLREVADLLDLPLTSFWGRLRGKRQWTPTDMDRIANRLDVDLPAFGEVTV